MADEIRVLVPLRSVEAPGKTRLGGCLDVLARRDLVTAMFLDLVDVLRGADVDEVVVLGGDASAIRIAEDSGCRALLDPPGAGLADVVGHARRGVAFGVDTFVVMPDLPMLTSGEVRRMLGSPAPVVIAPTADAGTGGLLLRRHVAMDLRFGPQSASHHSMVCLRAALTFEWWRSTGFEVDVDTPADLARLRLDRVGPATAELLTAPPFADLVAAARRSTDRRQERELVRCIAPR